MLYFGQIDCASMKKIENWQMLYFGQIQRIFGANTKNQLWANTKKLADVVFWANTKNFWANTKNKEDGAAAIPPLN